MENLRTWIPEAKAQLPKANALAFVVGKKLCCWWHDGQTCFGRIWCRVGLYFLRHLPNNISCRSDGSEGIHGLTSEYFCVKGLKRLLNFESFVVLLKVLSMFLWSIIVFQPGKLNIIEKRILEHETSKLHEVLWLAFESFHWKNTNNTPSVICCIEYL